MLIKATDTILRIYHQEQEVALHAVVSTKGNYITQEAHQPVYKQKKSESYYRQQLAPIGTYALDFMQALQQHRPYHGPNARLSAGPACDDQRHSSVEQTL
jgi:hypothetical protein